MNQNQPMTEDLLAKFVARETDVNESALVENWLNENEKNKKELADFEFIWKNAVSEKQHEFDTDLAWQKVKTRIKNSENKGKIIAFNPIRKPFFDSFKIAASITILLTAGLLIYLLSQKSIENLSIQTNQNTLEKVLPDGSKVFLNKNTKITYPSDFQGDTREISLNGEAFFEIKRNESQPFVIHANGTNIKVLGTSFNIKAYDKNVKVSVETGKVQFKKAEKETILTKGEEAEFLAENDTIVKKVMIDKNILAYKTHIYIFEDSSLEHITKILSEGYQVPILLRNPALKTCRLTTKFDNETLPNALNIIAETLNLKLSQENNRFYIDGEKCK